jgi:hypothetical protein
MNWLNELHLEYNSREDLVNIFGVILYTDANPYVKKVLSDENFWKALDIISGLKWVIFSIKPKKGYYSYPESSHVMMSFMSMHPTYREPKENEAILKEFNISSTKDIPLLLCFTQDKDGEILKSTLKIEDDFVDSAYNSLRKNIKVVTDAVDGILDENRKNSLGVYGAVNAAIDSHKFWERVKKGIIFYEWIKKFKP